MLRKEVSNSFLKGVTRLSKPIFPKALKTYIHTCSYTVHSTINDSRKGFKMFHFLENKGIRVCESINKNTVPHAEDIKVYTELASTRTDHMLPAG